MGSFGRNLRREREMRGISLDEIAQHTKISTRMLEAIESDRFELLPGGVFNRSFVLHYARFVGLDEALVGAEFDLIAGTGEPVDVEKVAAQREMRAVETPPAGEAGTAERTLSRMALLAGLFLLLAATAFTAWKWWPLGAGAGGPAAATPQVLAPAAGSPGSADGNSAPAGARSSAAPGAGTPSDGRAASPAGRAGPPGAGGAGSGTSPSTGSSPTRAGSGATAPPAAGAAMVKPAGAATPSPAADASAASAVGSASLDPARVRLRLQVDTMSDSWVAAYADGRKVWEAEMRAHETRTVAADSNIRLHVGNAGAVVLTLNGETQPPLGRRGEVKTVQLTAEDLKKQ